MNNPRINLIMKGDGCWPDLPEKRILDTTGQDWNLALLHKGMGSGRPSVALRIDLPSGKVVFAQTSLRLLRNAVRGFDAYIEGAIARGEMPPETLS